MRNLLHGLKSDESLMLAYQRGDSSAFESLYLRHKDGLFAFLYRSYPRTAVVEELAQDTWMAVINAVGRYKPEARFRTWLYQIAHNRLMPVATVHQAGALVLFTALLWALFEVRPAAPRTA